MPSETSRFEITMLKELLEAHVGPMREDIRGMRADLRIDVNAVRADLSTAQKTANDAHKRLDAYDNRIWGISFAGGGLVSAVFLVLKTLFQ